MYLPWTKFDKSFTVDCVAVKAPRNVIRIYVRCSLCDGIASVISIFYMEARNFPFATEFVHCTESGMEYFQGQWRSAPTGMHCRTQNRLLKRCVQIRSAISISFGCSAIRWTKLIFYWPVIGDTISISSDAKRRQCWRDTVIVSSTRARYRQSAGLIWMYYRLHQPVAPAAIRTAAFLYSRKTWDCR